MEEVGEKENVMFTKKKQRGKKGPIRKLNSVTEH